MKQLTLRIPGEILDSIQSFARANHPNEVILLLRGDSKKQTYTVTEFLHPPFARGNPQSASFPSYMLPIDFTIIGTVHSHPSGRLTPSTRDFHSFYGKIMAIIGPPYTRGAVAAFTKSGEVQVEVV